MAGIIPRFRNSRNVNFIIVGDGPKRGLLEEVRERANMQHRVEMLGAVEHSKVGNSIYFILDETSTELTVHAVDFNLDRCKVGLLIFDEERPARSVNPIDSYIG